MSFEAYEIFIQTKGESIVYDFIAFAVLLGNLDRKKKFEDGNAFSIIYGEGVLNCSMSISTSVDIFYFPSSEFVVSSCFL